MELHIPNAPPRGRPTQQPQLPWWAPAATRHAANYRPEPDFPAFYLATRVAETMGGVPGARPQQMFFPPEGTGPGRWCTYFWGGCEEVFTAVFVVGYLAQHPRAARLDDRTLLGLALGAYEDADCPWLDPYRIAAASPERRPQLAAWAPWWRAAAIWPQTKNMWVLAFDCEFLWQRRAELRVRDMDASGCTRWRRFEAAMLDERGWFQMDRKSFALPGHELGLAEVFPAVLGPDPRRWPRPYNTLLPEVGLAPSLPPDDALTPVTDLWSPPAEARLALRSS